MTSPHRPSSPYGGRPYAQAGPGQLGPRPPAQPPAFQRGLPNHQAAHLRRHPARTQTTWLTVAEVAAELRVSRMTVYRLIHGGDLVAARIGRSFRITGGAFDDCVRDAT